MNKLILYILVSLYFPANVYGTVRDEVIHQKASNAHIEICAQKKIESIIHLEFEIAYLKQVFDETRKGFADFTDKNIKIPHKHILAPEFRVTKKGKLRFSGFHHDMDQMLEKSDLINITNKVMGEHEIYAADVWYNNNKHSKTFFPSEWPREKVISKVMEAYDNFIKAETQNFKIEAGKVIVESTTNEGIKIRIIIAKSGEIISAYPLL